MKKDHFPQSISFPSKMLTTLHTKFYTQSSSAWVRSWPGPASPLAKGSRSVLAERSHQMPKQIFFILLDRWACLWPFLPPKILPAFISTYQRPRAWVCRLKRIVHMSWFFIDPSFRRWRFEGLATHWASLNVSKFKSTSDTGLALWHRVGFYAIQGLLRGDRHWRLVLDEGYGELYKGNLHDDSVGCL